MKLFLCSHFSSVGSLIKEEIDNKKVAFIPTASLREGYTGYVGSARKLFNKLGATVTEIDISTLWLMIWMSLRSRVRPSSQTAMTSVWMM